MFCFCCRRQRCFHPASRRCFVRPAWRFRLPARPASTAGPVVLSGRHRLASASVVFSGRPPPYQCRLRLASSTLVFSCRPHLNRPRCFRLQALSCSCPVLFNGQPPSFSAGSIGLFRPLLFSAGGRHLISTAGPGVERKTRLKLATLSLEG